MTKDFTEQDYYNKAERIAAIRSRESYEYNGPGDKIVKYFNNPLYNALTVEEIGDKGQILSEILDVIKYTKMGAYVTRDNHVQAMIVPIDVWRRYQEEIKKIPGWEQGYIQQLARDDDPRGDKY